MKHTIFMMLVVTGCFPSVSKQYECQSNAQCESGRICASGYCVVGMVDATSPDSSSAIGDAPTMTDAAPVVQTFAVGQDCDGSSCTGGYGGVENADGTTNAIKLCSNHGFPRALGYTISNDEPGGRFCTYVPNTMQFGCDGSCSGCNAITSVTCSNP